MSRLRTCIMHATVREDDGSIYEVYHTRAKARRIVKLHNAQNKVRVVKVFIVMLGAS